MKANGKLGKDVDIEELAKITKNFSGAELEGLVRAAQSCALNRLVKASSKVELVSILLNFLPPLSLSIPANQLEVILVSISPIFYEQLFCTKVFCAAFLCLQLVFVIFWWKDFGAKAAHKMLVNWHMDTSLCVEICRLF